MKKIAFICALFFVAAFGCGIGYIYYFQEDLLFQKTTLPKDYTFTYSQPFKEVFLQTEPDTQINALYFYTKQPKGLVIYFHGRGGNLANQWGKVAEEFTSRGYDFFIMDYRGFGKSTGKLSEKSLCFDAEFIYDYLCHFFSEKQIIVYGKSLGTGIATYLASNRNPKMLVLESPYFSILDLSPRHLPYLPRFLIPLLLKYHLRTDRWITKVISPIYIFHGTHDELVPYDSSLRLLRLLTHKMNANLITIERGKHNHLRKHPKYQLALDALLGGSS
ncbi:MAG: alpha/beta fold hydrolase [Chlamydiota bacterium]